MESLPRPFVDHGKIFSKTQMAKQTHAKVSIKPRRSKEKTSALDEFLVGLEQAVKQDSRGPLPPAGPYAGTTADKVMVSMLGSLTADMEDDLMDAIRGIKKRLFPVRVGTLCSGSDLIMPVLTQLFSRYSQAASEEIGFTHVLRAEMDKEKQRWIQQNCPPTFMCATCEEAAAEWATNLMDGYLSEVPSCDILFVSFSCKSL